MRWHWMLALCRARSWLDLWKQTLNRINCSWGRCRAQTEWVQAVKWANTLYPPCGLYIMLSVCIYLCIFHPSVNSFSFPRPFSFQISRKMTCSWYQECFKISTKLIVLILYIYVTSPLIYTSPSPWVILGDQERTTVPIGMPITLEQKSYSSPTLSYCGVKSRGIED